MAISKHTGRTAMSSITTENDLAAAAAGVRVMSPAECKQVDDALGLQLISIRFHKPTLVELKRVAGELGFGYQPLIRAIVENWLSGRRDDDVGAKPDV